MFFFLFFFFLLHFRKRAAHRRVLALIILLETVLREFRWSSPKTKTKTKQQQQTKKKKILHHPLFAFFLINRIFFFVHSPKAPEIDSRQSQCIESCSLCGTSFEVRTSTIKKTYRILLIYLTQTNFRAWMLSAFASTAISASAIAVKQQRQQQQQQQREEEVEACHLVCRRPARSATCRLR